MSLPVVPVDVEEWARLTALIALAYFTVVVGLILRAFISSLRHRRRARGRLALTRAPTP
ncbi:MAG: hypothetical protein QXP94_05675 [Thermofilaceae archaeon]